jgi:hypothetical protein
MSLINPTHTSNSRQAKINLKTALKAPLMRITDVESMVDVHFYVINFTFLQHIYKGLSSSLARFIKEDVASSQNFLRLR